jgi:hypothetical protein
MIEQGLGVELHAEWFDATARGHNFRWAGAPSWLTSAQACDTSALQAPAEQWGVVPGAGGRPPPRVFVVLSRRLSQASHWCEHLRAQSEFQATDQWRLPQNSAKEGCAHPRAGHATPTSVTPARGLSTVGS